MKQPWYEMTLWISSCASVNCCNKKLIVVEVVGQPEKEGVVHKLQAGIGQSILKNTGSVIKKNPRRPILFILFLMLVANFAKMKYMHP